MCSSYFQLNYYLSGNGDYLFKFRKNHQMLKYLLTGFTLYCNYINVLCLHRNDESNLRRNSLAHSEPDEDGNSRTLAYKALPKYAILVNGRLTYKFNVSK